MSDERFVKQMFFYKMGYKLDLSNPKTFNEKMQWMKLYYREPIFTKMVDKYEAKKIVSSIIGDDFVAKTYGVWNSFEEIDFSILPNQFVLKTTHDCGGTIICKDKATFDYNGAKKILSKHLKRRYFKSKN